MIKITTAYDRIFVVIIIVLSFNFSAVKAIGVTRPIPYDIELMRGESANFVFEIQAITSPDKIICSYSANNLEPLIIKFDQKEVRIEPGKIQKIYGQVTVPNDAPYGTYSGTISVSCGALTEEGGSGSVVKTTIGGSPFNVKVVEFREGEIKTVTIPETKKSYLGIIIIITLLIIVIGVYYYFKSKKKS